MRRTPEELDAADRAYRAAHPPLTQEQIAARRMEDARIVMSSKISDIDEDIRLNPGVMTRNLVDQLRATYRRAKRDAGISE